MFNRALYNVLDSSWPMMFIFIVVLVMVRLSYLRINHKRMVVHEEIFNLLFIIYGLLLFQLVTYTGNNGSGGLNLIPFKEMTRYSFGSKLFMYNIVGNILVFLPFGYFISSYVNAKTVGHITIITLVTSLTIELVQYRIGRAFDIDDIILNVAGGIIGFLIYVGLSAIQRHLPSIFKSDLFYNIVCIIVVAAIGIYFYRYVGFGWF